MVHLDATLAKEEKDLGDKGLKSGALGLFSSVVVGVASTAPAYSLAATLGFVVIAIKGLQAPIIAILAFVPMLFISYAYKELNNADPDCGTTFTWATRAFGPKTGWFGGWGIVAMTYICYRGIEVSARLQRVLLAVEVVMLLVFSVVALIRVGTSHHPSVSISPSWSWLNPFHISSFQAFVGGLVLMLFIYWGWDTAVAVNEETEDKTKTPGRAAIISTVLLLITYVLVIFAAQSFAGIGTKGIGLGNPDNASDVLNVLSGAVFGNSGFGTFLVKLLLLMVLSSAAASTQTTILPTARTTLSMAVYKALPKSFAKMHGKYLTPTVSTVVMGAISIALYVLMNYLSGGNVIADAVTSIGLYIALYYGLTAFTCVWYYRKTLTKTPRDLLMQGILPFLGGVIMYFAGIWSLWEDWDVGTENSYTSWLMPFYPHWHIGGAFMVFFVSAVAGLIFFIYCRIALPAFFKKQTLTRATPTLVPETSEGLPGAPN